MPSITALQFFLCSGHSLPRKPWSASVSRLVYQCVLPPPDHRSEGVAHSPPAIPPFISLSSLGSVVRDSLGNFGAVINVDREPWRMAHATVRAIYQPTSRSRTHDETLTPWSLKLPGAAGPLDNRPNRMTRSDEGSSNTQLPNGHTLSLSYSIPPVWDEVLPTRQVPPSFNTPSSCSYLPPFLLNAVSIEEQHPTTHTTNQPR